MTAVIYARYSSDNPVSYTHLDVYKRQVVSIRVSADDGRMSGEVVLAELQAKGLRPLHGQAVLYCCLLYTSRCV